MDTLRLEGGPQGMSLFVEHTRLACHGNLHINHLRVRTMVIAGDKAGNEEATDEVSAGAAGAAKAAEVL